MKKTVNAVNPMKGWQTVGDAVRERGVSRQRIHQILDEQDIKCQLMLGVLLVPKPFPKAKTKRGNSK